jgi:hypothetical protein
VRGDELAYHGELASMFGVELASHSATVLRGDGNRGFKLSCRRDGCLMVVGRAGRGIGGEGRARGGDGVTGGGGVAVEGLPSTGSINHYYLSVVRCLADRGWLFITF